MNMVSAPRWVDAMLEWPWAWPVARTALVGAYLLGGFSKLANFDGAVAEQAHFGLHPPALWSGLTIMVEIGASLLIVLGRHVWLAAGALGVFTGLAALIANAFWTMPNGPERFAATNAFFEHFGLIGGLALAAMVAQCRAERQAHG